jgi:hypothetical protein
VKTLLFARLEIKMGEFEIKKEVQQSSLDSEMKRQRLKSALTLFSPFIRKQPATEADGHAYYGKMACPLQRRTDVSRET